MRSRRVHTDPSVDPQPSENTAIAPSAIARKRRVFGNLLHLVVGKITDHKTWCDAGFPWR